VDVREYIELPCKKEEHPFWIAQMAFKEVNDRITVKKSITMYEFLQSSVALLKFLRFAHLEGDFVRKYGKNAVPRILFRLRGTLQYVDEDGVFRDCV
jgi:hypothetical protein